MFRLSIFPKLTPALLLLLVAGTTVAEGPDPRYWRFDDIVDQFAAWQFQYPDLIHVESIGLSGQGEAIFLARVSDNASTPEPEPRLFLHAAQHANEVNGTGAIMKTIQRLLESYGSDPEATAWVNGIDLCFLPIVNVDGHRYVFDELPSWADWRKTLRDNNGNEQVDFPEDGVDMNRNWGWFWEDSDETDPASQKYKGPYAFSEPEVKALRRFILDERPLLVVDYHSPVSISWTNYVFYPWVSQHGWGNSPDYDIASDIASSWASRTKDENGYSYSSIFTWDTLPKEQCWVYGNTGIITYIMEISDQCWWTGATVDTIAARVARGSEYLFEKTLAGPGIFGSVRNAQSGAALVAEVRIEQLHGDEVGPRLTEDRFGQFYRFTNSGSYTLSVSCEGFEPEQRQVSVSGGWTQADFDLAPISTGVAEGELPLALLSAANPVSAGGGVSLYLRDGAEPGRLELLDVRGRRVAELGRDLPVGRRHNFTLPSNLSSGIYLLRARTGSETCTRRITVLR